jgi:hypothetical protein
MKPETAAGLTRWWTRIYTMSLPRPQRDRRREELDSDLRESLADTDASRQILSRLVFGAFDDVIWSATQMERTARESFWWSVGSALTVSSVVIWLAYTPDGLVMRTWSWLWPLTTILHVLGLATFIGLRTAVDLRLTGRVFENVPVADLVGKLTPATVVAALVTILTGLALYMADAARFSANTMFQFKIGLLAAAMLNMWYLHAVTFRTVARWGTAGVPPAAARISAYLSLTLWAAMIVFSLLMPYTF